MEKALSNYRSIIRRRYDATTKQKELLDRWIREIERDIHDTKVVRKDEDYDHMAACFVHIYFRSKGFQVALSNYIHLEIKW